MPGHFQSMARSLYDLSLYGEVAPQRPRRTVGFFALVLLFSSLAMATALTLQLRKVVHNDLVPEIDKLPVVQVKNHEASVNVEQPWQRSFEDPNTHMKTVVIIDTTGRITDFAIDQQGLLLTRTQLKMKNPQNPFLQPLSLRDVDDVTIDAALIKSYIPTGLWIVFGAIAVAAPFWYTGARLLHALLLALVGLVAASSRKRPVPFGQLFTISIYALTPAIVLDLAVTLLGVTIPWFWLLYLVVAALFVVLGVRKIPDADPAMPPPQAPPPPMPPSVSL
jgi:hypothetical protein